MTSACASLYLGLARQIMDGAAVPISHLTAALACAEMHKLAQAPACKVSRAAGARASMDAQAGPGASLQGLLARARCK